MAATQEALYAGRLDLDLSWSEGQLPERERTKHVHRLHPYLGKFVPQLVEALLERYVAPGGHVLDPFAGSGTTLVQALESGRVATGVDIAGFNCLLMRVKTRRHNLDAVRRDLLWAHEQASALAADERMPSGATPYLRDWFAPRAVAELLHFRSLVEQVASADVLRVILARAARSARRTTHFDLDFPREPQHGPYWCHNIAARARPSARRGGSSCGTRSTRSTASRHSLRPVQPTSTLRCSTATLETSSSAGRSTASSPRRRTPA